MKLIWTRSTWVGDKQDIITWAYGHQCSHFAVSFFDESVFFHSTIGGVQLAEKYHFYKHRIKVFEIDLKTTDIEECELLKTLVEIFGDYEYDYKFFWWLTWAGFKNKILGIKPPFFIEKEDPRSIICHEVIQLLPDEILPTIEFKKSVMPQHLYLMIKDAMEHIPDDVA